MWRKKRKNLFKKIPNKAVIIVVVVVVLVVLGIYVFAYYVEEDTRPLTQTIDGITDKIVGFRLPFNKFGMVRPDPSLSATVGCKKIINASADKEYFIPTRTESEWDAFRDSVSSGNLDNVSLDVCFFQAPQGAITFFTTSDLSVNEGCPEEWTRLSQAKGMYLVNTSEGGVAGTDQGEPLGNKEDRPSGAHEHNLDDPGHLHSYHYNSGSGDRHGGGNATDNKNASPPTVNAQTGITETGAVTTTGGVTVKAGTPAPYVQYVVCQKD